MLVGLELFFLTFSLLCRNTDLGTFTVKLHSGCSVRSQRRSGERCKSCKIP